MAFFQTIYDFIGAIIPYSWAQADFILRAIIGLVLLAPLCAGMGIIVVNFRMAFFSDAISHSAFTGVALGIIFGIDPMITLVLFGLMVGLAITRVKMHSELSNDTVIGVFFSTVIALGIALISAKGGLTRNLQSVLYGDILSLTDKDLVVQFIFFLVIMIYLYVAYNRLFFIGLHQTLAHAQGINVKLYEYSFAALLSILVAFSIRAVGLLLVTAMLILPAASSRNVAKTAGGLFWWALLFAVISCIIGLFGSIAWNTATGATVILAASGCFLLTNVWLLVSKKG